MQNEHNPLLTGLTSAEAARLLADGQGNARPRAVGKSAPRILADNLFTLFNLLNLVLATALIAVGSYRNLLFLGVVVSNTVIGTVQALRAKRTMDKLELLATQPVEIIRDGMAATHPPEEIVPGDLLVIRQGEQLCVDGELLHGQGAMNESLLTGESEPVDKLPGDKLLSGSFVTEGTLYLRVTHVGTGSYAARVTAQARAIEAPKGGLMQSMQSIVRMVGAVLVPLGTVLFARQYFWLGRPLGEAVTATVAAVLGMIPEGLVLLTSMALAVGVVRLGRRGTLVSELYGIESLARVDTLCVDKTGTLTKGTMDVVAVEPVDGADMPRVEAALAAMGAALEDTNATQQALRARFAASPGWTPVQTVSFSSARKWTAATFAGQGTYVVGAMEFILGEAAPQALREAAAAHAAQGKRVLLLGHSAQPLADKALPQGIRPLALVLLWDVLRPDAADTLAYFARQDVRVKVISGDNPLTAMHVGLAAGLEGAELAVDATTLDTPEKLADAAARYTVFGRVTPAQKRALVEALQAQGHTVGMVGDGVNDIPAMKAADCAIAMAGGSDAARRVAHMTLLDESFAAVPDIVAEGRRVINNIARASSLFLVKTTFSFLLSLLLVFLPMRYPFAPIQMTLISAFTVGIPSFFLAMEPNNARVRGNFMARVLRNALPGGCTVVLLILINFACSGWLGMAPEVQSTVAVYTTGLSGLLVLLYTCRPLTLMRGVLVGLMTAGFYALAIGLGQVFYLAPLHGPHLWLTLALAAMTPPVMAGMRYAVEWVAKRREKGLG